jgi:hypothetical protein
MSSRKVQDSRPTSLRSDGGGRPGRLRQLHSLLAISKHRRAAEPLGSVETEYTLTRLEGRLGSAGPGSPSELVDHVLCDIDAFVDEAPQSDDLTVMAMAYRG